MEWFVLEGAFIIILFPLPWECQVREENIDIVKSQRQGQITTPDFYKQKNEHLVFGICTLL